LAVGFEFFARRRQGRELKRADKKLAARQDAAENTTKQFAVRQEVFAGEQRRQREALEDMQVAQERAAARPLAMPELSPSGAATGLAAEQRPLPPVVVAPEVRPVGQQSAPERAPMVAPTIAEEMQQLQTQEQEAVREAGDAWRRYYVDKHGNEIVTATPHGEQYYKERQQEIIRDRTNDKTPTASSQAYNNAASQPGLAGAVHMAYGSDSSAPYGQPSQQPGLPSGMTTPSLPTGQPAPVDSSHQLEEPKQKSQILSNLTNPWFWLMLALLAAGYFMASNIG
jgi:hypothetical protein